MILHGIIKMIRDAIAQGDDEIALEALMDTTDWQDLAAVEYCIEVAKKFNLHHRIDDILDKYLSEMKVESL